MKYKVKGTSLIIEGDFEAISSGINGGRGRVECLINHRVQPAFDHYEPAEYLNNVAESLMLKKPYFGLLTAVNMDKLCVMTEDYLTTFVTAGITHPSGFKVGRAGTINIIITVDGMLSESAMVGAIITATEAKGLALLDMGYDFLGTTTDAVIVAYENHLGAETETRTMTGEILEYAGPYTEFGEMITRTVMKGVKDGVGKNGQEYTMGLK
ncbi:MAG TPA: adenosylcobinamide hydrolase [Methanosarcinaceae archaeon]|nr:adenosylcobinamide hydrolase [Methanosarcinaceae archaeon]